MSEKLQEQAVDLYKRGERSKAAKLLKQLLQSEPKNTSAWYGLALCLDEPERKRYCLGKVLEIDPQHEKARTILMRMDIAEEHVTSHKHKPTFQSINQHTAKQHSSINITTPGLVVLGIVILGLIVGVVTLYIGNGASWISGNRFATHEGYPLVSKDWESTRTELQSVRMSLIYPIEVQCNKTVPIDIKISNLSDKWISYVRIKVKATSTDGWFPEYPNLNYFQGFDIKCDDKTNFVEALSGYLICDSEPLAPGDQLDLTLKANSINLGDYRGLILICIQIENYFGCLDTPVTTIVR